ncbi:hypothetical protein CPB84DRAFT_1945395 [Gymnopilus junonius]|uniref:Nephrocystin 3-like N-terminal domain-containing protein n=1 Tax=Gymnopilus junonius TaxID=109634 RepID=A0A9P5NJ09_GYMJU|nr:hypothetical protein CPB84DRAFT_1945395 [Gymnopilus junonius]
MFSSSKNIVIYGGSFHNSHGTNLHEHTSINTSGFERLLQAASPSAFHNSGERFDPPRCHPKTRLKVLEDISKWVDGTNDHHKSVMWVNGGAGVGKSAIAQTIAERLAEDGRLLASYFFSRTDPSRNNINNLVASIAYQGILYVPQIKEHIINAVEQNPLVFRLSLEAQFTSLITIPFRDLNRLEPISSTTSPWIIVLDGLDECQDHRAQIEVLNAIASSLRNSAGPFALLILSRHEKDLSMAFSSGPMAQLYNSVKLDDIYADDDIRFFLEDQFEELRKSHPLKTHLPSPWPTSWTH